jgi:transposase-like protein
MSQDATSPKLVPAPPAADSADLPKRRRHSTAYKAQILAECDAATEPGQIGAILRREGLYSSQLTDWRKRRSEGGSDGLLPKRTGRPPNNPTLVAKDREIERLRRELAATQEKLRRAHIIVEAQKKLAEALSPWESASGTSA